MKELYKIKEVIGSGAYSSVRLAIRREDKLKVAIKVLRKKHLTEEDIVGLQNEI